MTSRDIVPNKIEDLSFFHPNCDRHTAECLLLQNGVDGTFLIRNSSKQGEYAVSVSQNSFFTRRQSTMGPVGEKLCDNMDCSMYLFGHGEYKTAADLEYHFKNNPLLGGDSGQTVMLENPYPRKINEPNLYDGISIHAERRLSTGENNERRIDFSINSKDGFLTKVGAIFKTWKTRWFVLQKNELKYFKSKGDREPIRVLDLNECIGCEMENSFKDRANVFRIQFPWRTFYMFATTTQESEEWVRLIQWKLKSRQD
ncbi:hypothetical protein CHS0354_033155 [Potamilus streckersoni]|uniref:Dual adapter for phosphotyrosine and 3-phosphotyrosine and 3-phosphoinositide n=1 Tax=Potamilus streckersoni TaxID=2493646 RepID=A0AAE0S700_9BIVA|nr:hypothetical protein CHS0354_033155 [Potamilus streckersoni]